MSVDINKALQENYCLNCGSKLRGKFCHYCGQKKLEHDHGILATLAHFVGDFVHFDSLIFRTLFPLLFRPGFLVNEYLAGRRARFLNPIRMYVFLSIVFFSLFFFIPAKQEAVHIQIRPDVNINLDTLQSMDKREVRRLIESEERNKFVVSDGISYNGAADYLARQDSLSAVEKDGMIEQFFMLKLIDIGERLGSESSFLSALEASFKKHMPKLAFLLLPLIALWMKLLFIRGKVTYLSHLVFTIQWYNFSFVLGSIFLLLSLLPGVGEIAQWQLLLVFLYVLISWKVVYRQSLRKTIMKNLFFWWGFIVILGLGVLLTTLYSIFTM
jgi:hypothetical protein